MRIQMEIDNKLKLMRYKRLWKWNTSADNRFLKSVKNQKRFLDYYKKKKGGKANDINRENSL